MAPRKRRLPAMPLLQDITAAERRPHLRWAVRVRWLTIGGFSVLAVLGWGAGAIDGLRPCLLAGGGAAAVNALNHWAVRRGRALRRVTGLAVSADVVLITGLILATGGARSPFLPLYVVQVVSTALLVDLWIALLVAVASTAALTGALVLGGPAPPAVAVVWGLCLLYGLGLLSFVGGYLADRLRRSQGDLGAARQALDGTRRRLHRTEAQLVQSEKLRALGQFVAGIAHELNNPLGFISANLDAVRRALGAYERQLDAQDGSPAVEGLAFWRAELPAVLDDCAEGVRRAAEIVAGLRVFARADSGDGWTRADLAARLEQALALLRHRLPAAVAVRRELGALPPVECLAGQLDQVFVNVLANAIDAVGASGTITVRSRRGGPDGALPVPHVVIEVADSGPGIDPAARERLFEPFFTTKPEGQGTGLGLSVSYGIVERHGGLIAIDSPAGGGAVVTIALPLQRDSPQRDTEAHGG